MLVRHSNLATASARASSWLVDYSLVVVVVSRLRCRCRHALYVQPSSIPLVELLCSDSAASAASAFPAGGSLLIAFVIIAVVDTSPVASHSAMQCGVVTVT